MRCRRCGREVQPSYRTVLGRYAYFRCLHCGFQFIDWAEEGENEA